LQSIEKQEGANGGSQGFAKVLGFKLFYRVFGDSQERGTVLCLHGGPGFTHDYLLPLADLASSGYKVVFYDQLGCGKSEMPKNPALFTVERSTLEVEAFRRTMRLGRIHLMGSSYAGLLAISYALKYPNTLKSLITIGGMASIPLARREIERMEKRLPRKVRAVIEKYESKGEYGNPNYLRALDVFQRRHSCRMKRWPAELRYSLEHTSVPVYSRMMGLSLLRIVGNIMYLDLTDHLHKIHVPTMIMCGRYDNVSPKVAKSLHLGIKGSRLVIFEKSAHFPMWEEPRRFIETVLQFLNVINRA
jgi:proline iminopeptidase